MNHPFNLQGSAESIGARMASRLHETRLGDALSQGDLAQRLQQAGPEVNEALYREIASVLGLEFRSLGDAEVSSDCFAKLSAAICYQLGIAPLSLGESGLVVAVGDPFDPGIVERLERIVGGSVRTVLAVPADIQALLDRSRGAGEVLRGLSEGFSLEVIREDNDGKSRSIALDALDDASGPIVRLVNTLILDALSKRASDIHIECYARGVLTKYRIDGVLYPATQPLDSRFHGPLVSRLKVMAELDIAEKRVPQDGRFKLRNGSKEIDFRVSILPSAFGEDVVIRILDKAALAVDMDALSLEGLGIAPELIKQFRRSIHEPYGMVLITGPTGSGKTTTLYAALTELNAGEEKIITIEDPIEYQLDGIVQIPVNEKKGLTFARGLRSVLRHDPDKIMVGEIRDLETAQIAVQSALTGHLVFTTVHANNAYDVISRFGHMGVDLHAFVAALNCVMAQRLVRLICPRCRQPDTTVDAEMLDRSGLSASIHEKTNWWTGAGCDHCNGTGYRGRAAITEFLALSPQLRRMVLDRTPADAFQAEATREGMVTLRESAVAKAVAGLTTLKEINRVTFVD